MAETSGRPVCPECAQGKHRNCVQLAMTEDDEFTDCRCGCVESRTCADCGDVVPEGYTLEDHLNCNRPEDFARR